MAELDTNAGESSSICTSNTEADISCHSSQSRTVSHESHMMTSTAQSEPMGGNTHQDLIEGDKEEVPYHPISRSSQIVPQNPKKNELSHEDDMTTTSQPEPMGGNTYQDHIKGDDEVVPYHPNCRLSQIVAQNPKKNEYRALQRLVHQRRMTKGMMRRAFTLYNLEIGISSLTPEVLSSLEQLFELQDIQWPTKLDRLLIIADKFHYALRSLLRQYG